MALIQQSHQKLLGSYIISLTESQQYRGVAQQSVQLFSPICCVFIFFPKETFWQTFWNLSARENTILLAPCYIGGTNHTAFHTQYKITYRL